MPKIIEYPIHHVEFGDEKCPPGLLVPAGGRARASFGNVYALSPGIENLPETAITIAGVVDQPFVFDRLIVADECADAFEVRALFVNTRCAWPLVNGEPRIPAARFTERAPRPGVDFGEVIPAGVPVSVVVENVSDAPRQFVAKVVGFAPERTPRKPQSSAHKGARGGRP